MNNKTYYTPRYCRENNCHGDYLKVYYCGDASSREPHGDDRPAKRTQIYSDCNCLLNPPPGQQPVPFVPSNKISYGGRIVSLESPERGEMNKAEKSLNILPKSMRWAPELLAAHSEFCAEIRQRIGDADQHARVPSGSLHPSDDFEKSGSYWSNFRSVNPT